MYLKAFKLNKLRDLYFYMYVLIAQLYFSFPEIITELPTVTITELPLDRAKNVNMETSIPIHNENVLFLFYFLRANS